MADTLKIGKVELIAISDGALKAPVAMFFPKVTEQDWAKHPKAKAADGMVDLNFGSYIIRSGGRTVLVDTGMGPNPIPQMGFEKGVLLDSLKAKGIKPEQIDTVVITHLHLDHVGWNVSMDGGKPKATFPKARYLIPKKDWEYFRQPKMLEASPHMSVVVIPLQQLGVMDLIDGAHPVAPGVTTMATPGHTPGHISITITSDGQNAIVTGDAIHLPVQVAEPAWEGSADTDGAQAVQSRKAMLDWIEQKAAVMAAGHFPSPGYGRISRQGGKRSWQGV
ncbi:MAG: MBL fold metallo-hydrolase [Dehalococcoidia bacterium]|nr:MBL fold metallo-hydrolase [Dehalococcoidia bacterium]